MPKKTQKLTEVAKPFATETQAILQGDQQPMTWGEFKQQMANLPDDAVLHTEEIEDIRFFVMNANPDIDSNGKWFLELEVVSEYAKVLERYFNA